MASDGHVPISNFVKKQANMSRIVQRQKKRNLRKLEVIHCMLTPGKKLRQTSKKPVRRIVLFAVAFGCVLQGACAIWYNLLKNGDGDNRTRHAACPVLVGSKWGQ